MSRRKPKLREIVPRLHEIYAYFWPEIRRYRGLIGGSMLALLVSVLFRLLEPWPIKFFLDFVLGYSDEIPNWLRGYSPQTILAGCAIAVVLIVGLRALADYLSRVGFFVVGNRVVIRVRNRIFGHLQRLPLEFHRQARKGDLIIRVTRDVSLLRDVTATAMLPLVASCTVLLGMVVVMLLLNWQLTCLALLTLPLFWLTTIRIGKRIRLTAKRQRQREGAMATMASEALNAIDVIKAMSLEAKFTEAFGQRNSQSQKEDLKASRLSVQLGRTIDVLLACSTAIVLWFGGKLALQGTMSAGDVVVFLTYLKRSFKPAQEFAKYTARLGKAAAAGDRVIEVLDEHPESDDPATVAAAQITDGHLELQHIDFGYPKAQKILRGVTCEFPARALTVLVGPSGCGKSTLLSLLLRFYTPDNGQILADGSPIQDSDLASWRGQLSAVMQEPLLLADSIQANIACGMDTLELTDVIAAAQIANADEFIRQLPQGYETLLGERGATLSRGQQQRLAIARAAARKSPVLLMDEPTTGLDEGNQQIIADSILELSKQRTTIVATHNLGLAAAADQILFLDNGNIVERGNHAQLIAKQGRYAQWYCEQHNPTTTPNKRTSRKLNIVS